ncbi:hypothetical protein [Pedobacter alpinus]|uniref:Outer membrane protein beta-barrel domain-containing protein n=1 Tax=Pedobacter alpinus TaxID=1590643 RepID=A0ABW5TM13_9SPHI
MKLKTLIAFALATTSFSAMAQKETNPVVIQESLDWSKLRVRPGLAIYIPYVELASTQITGEVYTQAAYQLNKRVDVNAKLSLGSFTGVAFGGTLHTTDKMVNKSTKFRVGSSTKGNIETTSFYRNNSDYRVVKGPTAEVRIGKFGDSGFYTRIDGGYDIQTYGRSYFRGFAGNKNGFTSIRFLATVAKFNQAEYTGFTQNYESRVGAGGLVSLFAEKSPWKRVTFHLGLDGGYMKIFGVTKNPGALGIENNTSNYIMELKGGLSIGL